ncbi:uncharacterized protein LOC143085606 [Mytilus galloprovincialis]|uniref:uncharacterized protein LOC143085606 n=1 Tax=Mytilus galloprovincialis TaxID=29158 RepID=UPI003F7B7B8A
MAKAAACYTDIDHGDVESSIEDCDQHSVKLQNVVANEEGETLNDNKNNPCSVLVENELESWQEITDSGHYGNVYTFTHKKSNVNKSEVLTENESSMPIQIPNVNQKQVTNFNESTERRHLGKDVRSISNSKEDELCLPHSNVSLNRALYVADTVHRQLSCTSQEGTSVTNNVTVFQSENINFSTGTAAPVGRTDSHTSETLDNLDSRTKVVIQNHINTGIRMDKTVAFLEAIRKLERVQFLVITGNFGCGKKSMVKELLYHYTHEEIADNHLNPVIISSPEQWNSCIHIHPNDKSIIWLEGMFGSSGTFDKHTFSTNWECPLKNMLEFIQRSPLILIVTTMPSSIWYEYENSLRGFPFFKDFERFRFDMEEEFTFDENERYLMINEYFKYALKEDLTKVQICLDYRDEDLESENPRISARTLRHVARIYTPVGFIECCYKFVCNDHYFRRGVDFFHHPLELFIDKVTYLQKQMEDQEGKKYHFYLLLLILSQDGKIFIEHVEENLIFKELAKICSIKESRSSEILNHLANFTIKGYNGIYFKYNKEDNSCEFVHKAFGDAVCLTLGLNTVSLEGLSLALSKCSSKFLIEYIRVGKSNHNRATATVRGNHVNNQNRDLCLRIYPKHYQILLERFIKEIKDGNIDNVATHEALDDDTFVDFIEHNFITNKFDSYVELLQNEKSQFYGFLWYLFHQEKPKLRLASHILIHPPIKDSLLEKEWWLNTQEKCMWAACHLGSKESLCLLKEHVDISNKHILVAIRAHGEESEFVQELNRYKNYQQLKREREELNHCRREEELRRKNKSSCIVL